MNQPLRDGELFPPLRRARFEDYTLVEWAQEPIYRQIDANSSVSHIESHTVPAYRIAIPREDWNELMEIVTAHYTAASKNPAVAEAWHQYQMLIRLTAT